MTKVLVTGGAGYIGAHVAAELLNEGYSVRIYDDFSNGLHKRVDGKFRDIVEGDILTARNFSKRCRASMR